MSLHQGILNQGLSLIRDYKHEEPLHLYLKKYFTRHRDRGSRDRKQLRQLCYAYYRLGFALRSVAEQERLLIALFLTTDTNDHFVSTILRGNTFLPGTALLDPLDAKVKRIQSLYPEFAISDVFPWQNQFSEQLDRESYLAGLLRQPPVWIRVKAGFEEKLERELKAAGISFEKSAEMEQAWAVPQNSKLQDLAAFDLGYFEVQDISSQRCASFFQPQAGEHWYDCCAASGGKSLLLLSLCHDLQLTVSDIRENILDNLAQRFKRNGITHYTAMTANLEEAAPRKLEPASFDGIILDAPCSGSGTWGRNPEELCFFDPALLEKYSSRQLKIARRVIPLLKAGGQLIYITCSVFSAENELVIKQLEELGLALESSAVLQATKESGDTLFVARLRKAVH